MALTATPAFGGHLGLAFLPQTSPLYVHLSDSTWSSCTRETRGRVQGVNISTGVGTQALTLPGILQHTAECDV